MCRGAGSARNRTGDTYSHLLDFGYHGFRKGLLSEVWVRFREAVACSPGEWQSGLARGGGGCSHPWAVRSTESRSLEERPLVGAVSKKPALGESGGQESNFLLLLPSISCRLSPRGETHPSQQGRLGDEVHAGQPHKEGGAEKGGNWTSGSTEPLA